eukprot:276253_1
MSTNMYDIYNKKEHLRGRSMTVGVPNRKRKELNKIERHTLLLKAIKELGHDMSVFHLRWMPGEYLDEPTLQSVPMFWFKKFNWTKQEIEKLYKSGRIEITSKNKREMDFVFGSKKVKKK